MTDEMKTLDAICPEETQNIAASLGRAARAGDFIALFGPLGAGKTCFVQGLAAGLGVTDPVTSPTFIIMRVYRSTPPLCHVDAYRLQEGADLEDIGLSDWLDSAVVAVEWSERVVKALPEERLDVRLEHTAQGRRVILTPHGQRALELITSCDF